MLRSNYDEVLALWMSVPEVGVSPEFDSRERIGAYLDRNPGLSSVARLEGRVVGALLCGHDGRRGSLYHMAVAKEHRGLGIARRLVERSLDSLRDQGIQTAFLFVHTLNQPAIDFWKSLGWRPNPDIRYWFREF